MWFSLNPPRLLQLEPCPDDWLYYKKKCYYHSGAAADWDSSQKFCSAHGASLAVIDSHQELNIIIYRMCTTDFWIGLRKRGSEFFWVNGESFDTNLDTAKQVGRGGRTPFCTGKYCSPGSFRYTISAALETYAFDIHVILQILKYKQTPHISAGNKATCFSRRSITMGG
ncbi:C-type lectin domain family 2 member L-like [Dromaius novaehollandiae]|uniref:C-type lectin domain family 2 member L-like n=1 Tax=Dromaius novaehollandiae TaxID=8790 RepID=UPI00311E7F5C